MQVPSGITLDFCTVKVIHFLLFTIFWRTDCSVGGDLVPVSL